MEATYLTKTLRSGLTKDQVITNGACCLKPIDRERIKCEDTKFNTTDKYSIRSDFCIIN